MTTNRMSVLTKLQEYHQASDEGNEALKASLWQITKLRRKQNRGMLTMEDTFHADQIREELRARTVVRDRKEPELILEDDKAVNSSRDSDFAPEWETVDVLEVRISNKENNVSKTSSSNNGLRQRSNKGTDGGDKSQVDAPSSQATMTEDPLLDEEEILLQRDPLDLFAGVRPGDLKTAQKHAKMALASYIEAANRAAQILALLNSNTKK